MRISRHRAARLREYIRQNRCQKRPGYLHDWQVIELLDPMSFGAVVSVIQCRKCGAS